MSIPKPAFLENIMPCCGNPIEIEMGPRGGIMTNIKCVHCGTRFNAYVHNDFIMIFECLDDPDLLLTTNKEKSS